MPPEGLASVPDDQIIAVLQDSWRQVSQATARYLAALVELGRRAPSGGAPTCADTIAGMCQESDSWYWCTSQIEAALTFTARRADTEYEFALLLLQKLPQVWTALHRGEIDLPKARLFATYLGELTDRQVATVCARVLPRAPGWTTGQLAHRLAREVLAIDPAFTRRRYQKAVRRRGVWGYLAADGTAVLSAHGLSPSEAAAAAERLEDLAAAVRAAGHPHTEEQLRADLFVRLLDGRFNGFTREQIVAAMLAEATSAATGSTEADNSAKADVVAGSDAAAADEAPGLNDAGADAVSDDIAEAHVRAASDVVAEHRAEPPARSGRSITGARSSSSTVSWPVPTTTTEATGRPEATHPAAPDPESASESPGDRDADIAPPRPEAAEPASPYPDRNRGEWFGIRADGSGALWGRGPDRPCHVARARRTSG